MDNVKQNFLFKWDLQSTEKRLLMPSLPETCAERNYPSLLNLEEQNLGSCHRGCWDVFVPEKGRQTNTWSGALGDGLPQAWQILGFLQLLCHRAGPQPFLRALVALATAQSSCLGQGPNRYHLQYVCSQDTAAVKIHLKTQIFLVVGLKHHLKTMCTTQAMAGEKKYIELVVKYCHFKSGTGIS